MARKTKMQLVDPLDFLLLEELPEQGSQVGIVPLGRTVPDLVRHERFTGLTSDQVSGRLRYMAQQGLTTTVNVLPVSRGKGYQITPAGKRALREWRAQHRNQQEGGQ